MTLCVCQRCIAGTRLRAIGIFEASVLPDDVRAELAHPALLATDGVIVSVGNEDTPPALARASAVAQFFGPVLWVQLVMLAFHGWSWDPLDPAGMPTPVAAAVAWLRSKVYVPGRRSGPESWSEYARGALWDLARPFCAVPEDK